jgi:hypothetical protein
VLLALLPVEAGARLGGHLGVYVHVQEVPEPQHHLKGLGHEMD